MKAEINYVATVVEACQLKVGEVGIPVNDQRRVLLRTYSSLVDLNDLNVAYSIDTKMLVNRLQPGTKVVLTV